MQSKACILGLLLVVLVAAAGAAAETREVVLLRSGYQIAADQTEIHDGQLVLRANGGEIRFAIHEVVSITPVVANSSASPLSPAADAHLSPIPATEPNPVTVQDLIRFAAERQGLPEAFVRSVAEVESALSPDALSPKGARGVMQLMPATATELGVDATNPVENVEGGARLLRMLLLRYQHEPDQVRRALAAYNAGPGAVAKHRGVPPYRETQRYIERVLRRYQAAQPPPSKP